MVNWEHVRISSLKVITIFSSLSASVWVSVCPLCTCIRYYLPSKLQIAGVNVLLHLPSYRFYCVAPTFMFLFLSCCFGYSCWTEWHRIALSPKYGCYLDYVDCIPVPYSTNRIVPMVIAIQRWSPYIVKIPISETGQGILCEYVYWQRIISLKRKFSHTH